MAEPYVDSLLDRLAPAGGGPRSSRTESELDRFARSLARDLADLLNTRRVNAPWEIDDPVLRRSILGYGVMDASSVDVRTAGGREAFAEEIRTVIETFETRLERVRIRVVEDATDERSMRLEVLAGVRGWAGGEVRFDSAIDPVTSEVSVRGEVDG